MRYLILINDPESAWAKMAKSDTDAMMGQYFKYTEEMRAAKVLLAGEALQPVHTATTVRVRNGKTVNTDGPFAETKEQLGGFYLIDVPNLDEALKWAAKCPSATLGSIEVRPVRTLG